MRPQSRTAKSELAELATLSHGVVTRTELLGGGFSAAAIKRRVQSGLLLPEYPGVYRVGHRAPSTEARYLAAVRACGPGALLSGPPAGHLLRPVRGAAPPPDVLTTTERRIEGITTRRCRRIDRRDAMEVRAIPVTTVPRTPWIWPPCWHSMRSHAPVTKRAFFTEPRQSTWTRCSRGDPTAAAPRNCGQ